MVLIYLFSDMRNTLIQYFLKYEIRVWRTFWWTFIGKPKSESKFSLMAPRQKVCTLSNCRAFLQIAIAVPAYVIDILDSL